MLHDTCERCRNYGPSKVYHGKSASTNNIVVYIVMCDICFAKSEGWKLQEEDIQLNETQIIALMQPNPAPEGLNEDQRDIWNIYEKAKITAIRKNLAYGSSVFTQAVVAPDASIDMAIRVRMSDKINRLRTLIANPEKNMIADESIKDTFMDLGTYCFLLMICLNRQSKADTVKGLVDRGLLREATKPPNIIPGQAPPNADGWKPKEWRNGSL